MQVDMVCAGISRFKKVLFYSHITDKQTKIKKKKENEQKVQIYT